MGWGWLLCVCIFRSTWWKPRAWGPIGNCPGRTRARLGEAHHQFNQVIIFASLDSFFFYFLTAASTSASHCSHGELVPGQTVLIVFPRIYWLDVKWFFLAQRKYLGITLHSWGARPWSAYLPWRSPQRIVQHDSARLIECLVPSGIYTVLRKMPTL